MPILITIATITLLFKGSKDHPSFLNPPALRGKFEKFPEGSTRTEALGIVDQLETLGRQYEEVSEDAINAYIADVEKWESSADILIKDLQPSDQLREKSLQELIQLRGRMVQLLSVEEWIEVFGKASI
jgi:hypothetical protein